MAALSWEENTHQNDARLKHYKKLSAPMGSVIFAAHPVPFQRKRRGMLCASTVQKPCFASVSIVYRPIVKII